jgi:23S rRNA pseudouridine2604 synthase
MEEQNNAGVSLNKYISQTGICSRREADRLIDEGKVTLNGEVAKKGNRVLESDIVKINGKPLKSAEKTVYLAYHKPVGITSTTDLKDKTNIIQAINYPKRIFPIGRLDKDSEGLIFLTNDGDIVNKILRASNNHEKEYLVTVNKPITPVFLEKMSKGVPILGVVTKPCTIRQESKFVFRIILTQGLNRQIRRMCEFFDFQVVKLKRIRIMNVTLENLPPKKWRYLTPAEIDTINKRVKNSSKTAE